jgi:uncharacterized protein
MKENLILIFARNPELGKVKTRLAATIGDQGALEIYNYLLDHTKKVVFNIKATKRVLYSEEIIDSDIWESSLFEKHLQFGNDLGARMKNAFADGFDEGYEKIIIIGTDLYDLEASDIKKAFEYLDDHDVVIGPAEDGGYYLLGLKTIPDGIFINKNWSSDTVLKDTQQDIKNFKCHLLPIKNDIDTFEDIKSIPFFNKYW